MSAKEWIIRQILGWLYCLLVVAASFTLTLAIWNHNWPLIWGTIVFGIGFRLAAYIGLKVHGDL